LVVQPILATDGLIDDSRTPEMTGGVVSAGTVTEVLPAGVATPALVPVVTGFPGVVVTVGTEVVVGTEEMMPGGGFVMNVLSGVTIALPDESRE
jgi:hypothetical protein